MAKEIERKFLVNPVLFNNYIFDYEKWGNRNIKTIYYIEQVYFETPILYRVRKKTNLNNNKVNYFICTKYKYGIERQEFESKIKPELGESFLQTSNYVIRKHRFVTIDNWEVDHYLNSHLCDLWVAEKELKTIDEKIELPNYVIEEITGKEGYSNYEIWKRLK